MNASENMHRRIVSILGVLLLSLAMACGGGSSGGGSNSPSPSATAPSITTQPQGQSVTAGQTATFTVAASGTAPLSYQWKKGGTAISGATSASYTTPATATADNGASFTVTVSNNAGQVTSSPATLTVTGAVNVGISVSPESTLLSPHGTLTFIATVTGAANTAVSWTVQEPGGGTVDSSGKYTAPATEGTYHVVATSAADASKTATAIVHVSSSSVIPPDRVTVWNPGLNAVGGIPARTTVYTTLNPSGSDDTAAIQAALNACPANQVVKLGPGTFIISDPGLEINRSNVTLRGSGPGVTKLVQRTTAQYPVVIMGWRWIKHTVSRPLSVDATKGSTSITVSDATGLKVGEIITLNQLADETRSDTVAPIRKVYWGPNATNPSGGERRWFCEQNRPIGQTLEITAINGKVLTLSTPIHIDFETALQAHISRMSTDDPDGFGWAADWNSQVDGIKHSGLEDLAVSYGGGGDGGGNIHLWGCAYCWVKNVESSLSIGHSCNIENCLRCEVRDSYFHTTQDPNPGGAGYGIGVNLYGSDNLFENNIVWGFNKLTIGRASGGGNVWGYNYLQDGYGSGYVSIPEVGCGANHYAGSHMELFEGNESFNDDSESYWGNPTYQTFFRNHFTGLRVSAPPLQLMDAINRRIVGVDAYAWWFSYVGNVLGFPAMPLLSGTDPYGDVYNQTAFIYQTDAAFFANEYGLVPVWNIGHTDEQGGTQPNPLCLARTYRHGNYDYLTNATVWDASVTSHALPASLYLTSKPAFMSRTDVWPWVTPENENTPIAGVLPAKARFFTIQNLALSQQ